MTFIVYSKDNCSYCHKLKQVLELTGKKFIILNLGEDFDREEFLDRFGEGSTFPQVIYDGENIGGCVETIRFVKKEYIRTQTK